MKSLIRTYLLIAAALLLAACSSDDNALSPRAGADSDVPLRFSVPAARAVWPDDSTQVTPTRATTGPMDNTTLKNFGVFAWTNDKSPYNFMNNQLVSGAVGGTWTYSPVKFWPADDTVTISLLAYAPYDDTQKKTDTGTTISYTLASSLTDLLAQDEDDIVDLLWGTNSSGLPYTGTNTISKQAVDGEVKLYFHHALSKLSIKFKNSSGSAITVTSFEEYGFTKILAGTLNLNNTTANTANWTSTNSTTEHLTLSNLTSSSSISIGAGADYKLLSDLIMIPNTNSGIGCSATINGTWYAISPTIAINLLSGYVTEITYTWNGTAFSGSSTRAVSADTLSSTADTPPPLTATVRYYPWDD